MDRSGALHQSTTGHVYVTVRQTRIKTGALQQYSRRMFFIFTFPWPPVIFKAANICNYARGTLFLFIRSPQQPTAALSVRCVHSLPAKQKVSIIHHSAASVCKYSPADWHDAVVKLGYDKISLHPPPSSLRLYISVTCCMSESLYSIDLFTALHSSKCSHHISPSAISLTIGLFYSSVFPIHFFFFLRMICDAHCFISSMEAKWQRWLGPPLQIIFFLSFFFLRPLNFSSNKHKVHSPLNLWQFNILH